MDSYLKKSCTNLGLKLGDIKNKFCTLYTIINGNISLLRTHKLLTFIPINFKLKHKVVQNIPAKRYVNKNKHFRIESDVESITKKDLLGKEKKIDSNSTITLSNNDLIELTIIIKPPTT